MTHRIQIKSRLIFNSISSSAREGTRESAVHASNQPLGALAFLSRLKLSFPKLPFPSLSNACHAGYLCESGEYRERGRRLEPEPN